ncbi:MAG: ACP S-malonyltransferase [Chitinispirillales bacterium]|jgi:[acyl-carrier-protein] S-malonyltransferase|nr:ACP S-malonyltransferase [Chitinispirillales bacterium]
MKISMLFPGQGSQFTGMAKDFYEEVPAARLRFEEADKILGRDLSRIIFEGPSEELTATQNTQPALFTVEAVITDFLMSQGAVPQYAAGHSLGEYSALYAAGVIGFEDGLKTVAARGAAMAEAGRQAPGAMAAVMGIDREKTISVLSRVRSGIVVAANENSPEQTVISGEVEAVNEACVLLKEVGAKRTVVLPVSGAFHSPLMRSAADKLQAALVPVVFSTPRCPVITNVTAKAETDPALMKDLLVKQLMSPVKWVDSMITLSALSPDFCAEVGPGTVLKGLTKKCAPSLNVISCDTVENLYSLINQNNQECVR